MSNKKVKNTTATDFNNIKFKSKLEVTCYKRLLEAGFTPLYEQVTYLLMEGFKLGQVLYYAPVKKRGAKSFDLYPRRIMNMTYTPDFTFVHNGYIIIFDTKGQPNDTYPLKKKLFLKILEESAELTGTKYIFFEPHNQGQILSSIEIIKSLPHEEN